jgi:hypothetical protein
LASLFGLALAPVVLLLANASMPRLLELRRLRPSDFGRPDQFRFRRV